MSNLQSDVVQQVTHEPDLKKDIVLSAHEQQAQTYRDGIMASSLGIYNMGELQHDLSTIPATKRLIYDHTFTTADVFDTNLLKWTISKEWLIDNVSMTNIAIGNYTYIDFMFFVSIQITGNPLCTGTVISSFVPNGLPTLDMYDGKPTIEIANHFSYRMQEVFTNSKVDWQIPIDIPFKVFRLQGGSSLANYQIGQFAIHMFDSFRANSNLFTRPNIKVYVSAATAYSGGVFSDDQKH